MKTVEILKPIKSLNGNTVYISYNVDIRENGQVNIHCHIAQEGYSYGNQSWSFGQGKYNSPKQQNVKIQTKVNNTQGFISDIIDLKQYNPLTDINSPYFQA